MIVTRASGVTDSCLAAGAAAGMRVARLFPVIAAIAALVVLTACGGVTVRPEPVLPKPLIEPIPADVGLVIPSDMRSYTHKETRWGVDWEVVLGPGHTRLMRDVFKDVFREVEEFKDVESAKAGKDLKAVFEPRIDQYSFVTARETGGRYYAVTIRYRINLYTPQGEKADTFTLTGYGNALAKGISSGAPRARARVAAMRVAAAKFLVQFPDQPVGQQLARNEAITVEKSAASAENAQNTQIEAVPIDDPMPDTAALPAVQTPPAQPTPAPEPASSGSTPDPNGPHDAPPKTSQLE
jgi:hypothetical protein